MEQVHGPHQQAINHAVRLVPLRGDAVVTVDRRTIDPANYKPAPQAQPQQSERPGFFARIFRRDGSFGTPVPEPAPAPKPPTGAIAALQQLNQQINELRTQVADLHGRAATHHEAERNYTAAVANLKRLEQEDVDAAAVHALDNTPDHDATARAAGIGEAERSVVAAHRARQVATSAIAATNQAVARVENEIKALESQSRHVLQAALAEQLTEFAPLYRRAWEQLLAAEIHAFALVKAHDALIPQVGGQQLGSGLTAHLRVPHPEHPSYRGLEIPRDLHLQIEAESRRVLEEFGR